MKNEINSQRVIIDLSPEQRQKVNVTMNKKVSSVTFEKSGERLNVWLNFAPSAIELNKEQTERLIQKFGSKHQFNYLMLDRPNPQNVAFFSSPGDPFYAECLSPIDGIACYGPPQTEQYECDIFGPTKDEENCKYTSIDDTWCKPTGPNGLLCFRCCIAMKEYIHNKFILELLRDLRQTIMPEEKPNFGTWIIDIMNENISEFNVILEKNGKLLVDFQEIIVKNAPLFGAMIYMEKLPNSIDYGFNFVIPQSNILEVKGFFGEVASLGSPNFKSALQYINQTVSKLGKNVAVKDFANMLKEPYPLNVLSA